MRRQGSGFRVQGSEKKIKVYSKMGMLFVFFCLWSVSAETDIDLNRIFYKANELYASGEYTQAIEEYKRILEEGHESGSLYYNLGNSYFKAGYLGEAILYYERARRLMPRDGDLLSNYSHASSLVKGNIYEPRERWFLRFIYKVFEEFTINEITILLSVIYLLITAALLAAALFNIRRQAVIAVSILAVVAVIGLLELSKDMDRLGKEAVMIPESAEAKFEPFERATTHFTLYEGMKVRMIQKKDGWRKIERPDGKVGWVEGASLEII
ncbi:MAG: tetratricopeptide repeat protein [Candidatus Omnitrophota bacterium]